MSMAESGPTGAGGHDRVDEISISQLRRDCALATRGVLMLSIAPGMILLLLAMRELSGAQAFELERLYSWKVWLPLIVALAIMLLVRRLTSRLDRGALMAVFWGYAVIGLALVAAALWLLMTLKQPIPWGEIGGQLAGDTALLATLLLVLAVLLALSSLLLWYGVVGPLGAARRLLRTRLPDGRRVIEVLNGIPAVLPSGTLPRPSRAAVAGRLACLAAAAALGIVLAGSVVWLLAQEQYLIGLAIEFALLAAIIGLIRLGSRITAIDATALLAADDRPPVLFLRSFQDDAGKLEGEWAVTLAVPDSVARSAIGRLATAVLATAPARKAGSVGVPRLEEVIAGEVARLGPFVAVGSPHEPLPMLGAARAYYDNDTWQTAIRRWIDMAQLIVKVAGPTQWIRWELGHIIGQGALLRLIIVFPRTLTEQDRMQRWQNIAVCLDGTPWQQPMATIDAQNVMALRFRSGGGIETITGAAHRGLDAALAMRILLDGMHRDGVLRARPTAGPSPQV
jgi:hypothetical protein